MHHFWHLAKRFRLTVTANSTNVLFSSWGSDVYNPAQLNFSYSEWALFCCLFALAFIFHLRADMFPLLLQDEEWCKMLGMQNQKPNQGALAPLHLGCESICHLYRSCIPSIQNFHTTKLNLWEHTAVGCQGLCTELYIKNILNVCFGSAFCRNVLQHALHYSKAM